MRLVTKHGTFVRADIKDISLFVSESITAEELAVDTLDAELRTLRECGTIFRPKGAPVLRCADGSIFTVRPLRTFLTASEADFQRGESVLLYGDDNTLEGKFYMKSISRVGALYAISCTSAMGLLDSAGKHYGGVFSGEAADDVIADIIGDLFPYSVDKRVAAIKVRNGYLPIAGRRGNLQRVLFAYGISVKRDGNQDPYFTLLSDEAPIYIPDSSIFLGGEVSNGEPASQVRVTEHQYNALSTVAEETLFSGSVLAEAVTAPSGTAYQGALVEFSEPHHSLQVTGGTLLESGVNYAVLGPGNNVTLTGKPYNHMTRMVIRTKPGVTNPGENTVDFPECTMVCAANSDSVADRMMSFYGYSKIISQDIKVKKQRPGDYVELSDPWRQAAKGFIQSMEFSFGRILRAATTIVTGFVSQNGSTYENETILTGSGVYTVPEGVYRLRYTLIQGAQGGSPGRQGNSGGEQKSFTNTTNAERANGYLTGAAGKGGDGGKPGRAGKVFRGTMDVTPGQKIPYNCGTGGMGAVFDPDNPDAEGNEGGHTTFGNFTSVDGEILPGGFLDDFTGEIYGVPGTQGIPGGDSAGAWDSSDAGLDGYRFIPAGTVIDEDGTVWAGGETQKVAGSEDDLKYYIARASFDGAYAAAAYALGSGAAAGANGEDGVEHGKCSYIYHPTEPRLTATAVNGLPGAAATKTPKKAPLTVGGRGGYGGGGGSPSGFAFTHLSSQTTKAWKEIVKKGTPGVGGLGGPGGQGGDGLIIINF